MQIRNLINLLLISHILVAVGGFMLGIYALPVLISPPSPSAADLADSRQKALFTGQFRRDLTDSDLLHWGEGDVYISATEVAMSGELAPGPDYRLYFSPEFVETEADFARLKPAMQEAGSIRSFNGFRVKLPPGLDPARYNTVIVWCEAFGQFITAAAYR